MFEKQKVSSLFKSSLLKCKYHDKNLEFETHLAYQKPYPKILEQAQLHLITHKI